MNGFLTLKSIRERLEAKGFAVDEAATKVDCIVMRPRDAGPNGRYTYLSPDEAVGFLHGMEHAEDRMAAKKERLQYERDLYKENGIDFQHQVKVLEHISNVTAKTTGDRNVEVIAPNGDSRIYAMLDDGAVEEVVEETGD